MQIIIEAEAKEIEGRISEASGRKETDDKVKRFETLARPLMEFLEENYHPYCAAIIDSEGMKLVETSAYIPGKENAHCGE